MDSSVTEKLVYSSDSQDDRTQYWILLAGLIVGLVSAYSLAPTSDTRLYTVLATVQGSFLAISISVVLLSFQITANEYTSLSLGDIQSQLKLERVILLFVFSILLDLHYATNTRYDLASFRESLSDLPGVVGQALPTLFTASAAAGVATGLATICLLQIVPVRNRMVSAVGPENLLKSRVESLDSADLPLLEKRTLDEPPQRNPLLAIDQILNAAKDRNDEFTIRRSIYEMERATSKLVQLGQVRNDSIDLDTLFEYWDGCVESACDGSMRRLAIAAHAQQLLVQSLLEANQHEVVRGRIDHLSDLTEEALRRREYQQLFLKDYAAIGGELARHDDSENLNYLPKKLQQISEYLLGLNADSSDLPPSNDVIHVLDSTYDVGYNTLMLSVLFRTGRQEKREEFLEFLLNHTEEISRSEGLDDGDCNGRYRHQSKRLAGVTAAALSRDDMRLGRTSMKAVVELGVLMGESPGETASRVESPIQRTESIRYLLMEIDSSLSRNRYEYALPPELDRPDQERIQEQFKSILNEI